MSASVGGVGGAAGSTSASSTGGSTACEQDDCCPDDPDKTEPGLCGCGESEADSDSDGSPDCVDRCSDDPAKTRPGECGCGTPEQDSSEEAGCLGIKNAIRHRYSFNGSGTEVSDTIGSADGTLVGTTLSNSGQLVLTDDGPEQYVELPAGIVSTLSNASIEAWFTWAGSTNWQRLFDFGSTEEGVVGKPGTGMTYLFFTPRSSNQAALPRGTFSNTGLISEVICAGSEPLPVDTPFHVALSIDTSNHTLTLYLDGMLQSAKAFPGSLATLDDVNNWLGRSQYQVDPQFVGTIEELRIYDAALTPQQVLFNFATGPDASFLEN